MIFDPRPIEEAGLGIAMLLVIAVWALILVKGCA
jgi:hypothetical protein